MDVVEQNRIQNVDEIGTLVDILDSSIVIHTNPPIISNTFKSERGIKYSTKNVIFLHLQDIFVIWVFNVMKIIYYKEKY